MTIEILETDDPKYFERVTGIVRAVIDSERPEQYFVIRVKNWFGKKWLRFSGKAVGRVPILSPNLTLPPFVPSRVLSEICYKRSAGGCELSPSKRLHITQESSTNLHRPIARLLPLGTILFWISSESQQQGRGALMVYLLTGRTLALVHGVSKGK
jgi:hypothetical protein